MILIEIYRVFKKVLWTRVNSILQSTFKEAELAYQVQLFKKCTSQNVTSLKSDMIKVDFDILDLFELNRSRFYYFIHASRLENLRY